MKNCQEMSVAQDTCIELHDSLAPTDVEASINHLPAGIEVLLVHSHRRNKETYGILSRKGFITIDDGKIELRARDWLRIASDGERQISAASDSLIGSIYIQVKADSLEGYTMTDGVVR